MKKSILGLFTILSISVSAQINYHQSFEGDLPVNWVFSILPADDFMNNTVKYGVLSGPACDGAISLYKRIKKEAPNQTTFFEAYYVTLESNGGKLDYSYQYNARGAEGTGKTHAILTHKYSVDAGNNWVEIQSPITLNTENGFSIPCTTISGVIPQGVIPPGANFRLAITVNALDGADFYFGIDDYRLVQSSLSTNEVSKPSEITMFPNPVKTEFTLNNQLSDIININVIDMSGKLVETFTQSETYDVSNLKSGNYLLKIQTKNKTIHSKFIKQ